MNTQSSKDLTMKNGLKISGYVIYAILVTMALLYYRFPSEAFCEHLIRMAGRMDPEIIFSTRSLHPSFPPGLRMLAPVFSLKEHPEKAVFEARQLSVSPGIGSFLRGDVVYFFDALAYGGTIKGHIQFNKNGDAADLSVSLKNVRIHEYGFLPDFGFGDFSGNLKGDVTYSGPPGQPIRGAGTGNIRISEGKIDLLTPFLGLETIPFGKLQAQLILKNGTVNVKKVSLDGKGFQGSLSGTIHLNRIMIHSRLNLKGVIEPFAPFLGTLKGGPALLSLFHGGREPHKRSFIIQGTFRTPKFRFTAS